ncbi:glycosyltransferase family 4 protein [Geobacter hydrogenophilus]|uniref:Glycosyltransferase WbuB n=1 Tax=Geobacter hydrogenophilus TaxID=40983 RepID=A0A9W6FX59_9BACT|nr:glycosyltransferase family 4 protein [Geobacter hydrogenophilus]MBT0895153.1 glycosyltransferase family 4 protein [Geobacter hydrogenophilus]GLI36665.1 glycosyltransferase WbuB [Geobacter hydrogenophilus]
MNILLVNHYAGSPVHGMEYRPFYLAREWVRLGHSVRILASAESHVRARQPDLLGRKSLEEVIEGVSYSWYRTPPYVGNGIGRVRNMASFVGWLYREGKRIADDFRPDVVIASSTYPMDIWPAHRIARMAGARLVYEVHDLWPLSPIELGGMPRWHPFIILVQIAEDYAYRHADSVVSMLPKVREYMESRGMAPHKLHIVPNGIDPAEWDSDFPPLEGDVKAVFKRFREEGFSIVGYAGAHGVANALDAFLEAAVLMAEERVVFMLVGNGPEKAVLQRQASAAGLRNVCFLDPVKKNQIPSLLKWFDVAYIGLQRQPLFRFGIAPNKLMDYMMAGCPVLMAIEAGNDPVGEAGCGLTVMPEDAGAIAKGIRTLLAMGEKQRNEMGRLARKYILQHHTYLVLARRFLEAVT